MTASRKDRRRKVQKLVDRIKDAADAGDWERELGEDIKVERSEVAAGKMTRFARVSSPYSARTLAVSGTWS
jgi:hypothetical protein